MKRQFLENLTRIIVNGKKLLFQRNNDVTLVYNVVTVVYTLLMMLVYMLERPYLYSKFRLEKALEKEIIS